MSDNKSNIKKALADLRHSMFNPTPIQKALAKNPYFLYTFSQLSECLDEICAEIENLPPYAFKKIEELRRENEQIREVIELLYPEANKDDN